ncbi:MAG: RNA polymerase sigma-70 factor [Cytophagales bacterium]|nr:RNA polymerase sigma-70 factor [Cytophagales bacterium]
MIPDSRPLYSDEDLRTFLLQDDRRGLEILYKKYYAGLYRFAYLLIKREDLSEDIVLEVFFKLWKIRHHLPEKIAFKPYLYKAAKNLAINTLKKLQQDPLTYDCPDDIPSHQADISQLLEVSDLEDKINIAIQLLPPKCQLVFKLSRYEDMTYPEIADYLNISVKTVENQMGKALKKIREHLKPYLSGI